MAAFNISHPTVVALNLPSCAIFAVDSRIFRPPFCEIVSDRYDKIIELHPTGFLGCFGDCHVIDQVRDALVADLPNERSMGELALIVQNAVNTILENSRGEDGEIHRKVEFVLVGGRVCDSRCYVYKISKGEDTWMCLAKREVGRVATAGSRAVTTFLENNNLDDENMTEGEAVDYAFKCMKYAVEHDWFAGGRIQVVAMKPGSSVVHTWEQNDPTICSNEYLYQEPRIINGH